MVSIAFSLNMYALLWFHSLFWWIFHLCCTGTTPRGWEGRTMCSCSSRSLGASRKCSKMGGSLGGYLGTFRVLLLSKTTAPDTSFAWVLVVGSLRKLPIYWGASRWMGSFLKLPTTSGPNTNKNERKNHKKDSEKNVAYSSDTWREEMRGEHAI